jgi:hypothetical protein
MTLNTTTFEAALKVHYTDDRIKNLVYKNNPFLAVVPKMEAFGGRNLPIPIQYGVPQSRSATFGTARTARTNASSQFKEFVLTRVKDYCIATIDAETMEASIGNPNAFMEAASSEIDSALHSCTRSLATALYRDGTGVIGTAAAGGGPGAVVVANVLQLATPDDVVNFEVGMSVDYVASGTGLPAGKDILITAVDRDLGTITITAGHTWNAGGAGVAILLGDGVFCSGDFGLKISGLQAWVPDAAPGAGAFFGVDRTADTSRLGGVRMAAGGLGKRQALIRGTARLAREGGMPTHCFMNHGDYAELLEEMNDKVDYAEVAAYERGDISFAGCLLHTPTGSVRVIPDHNCPMGNVYVLQMDTWKLYSLGGAPKILQADGMRVLRETDSDGIQVRVGYYAQLGCRAPGYNLVITGF